MTKIVKPDGPKVDQELMKYQFNWRSPSEKEWQKMEVVGHRYYEENNRMVLFKENGGIFEIPSWNEHYSDLGEDWANKIKETEKELANQESEEPNADTRPN